MMVERERERELGDGRPKRNRDDCFCVKEWSVSAAEWQGV